METLLSDLQSWYAAQCDGDWEHCFGITIGTLDNPGWSLTVELEDTILEDKIFTRVKKEESETLWIECFVENKKFTGYAGPHQLEELISTFLAWAKTEPNWLTVEYETEQQAKEREDKELWNALGEENGSTECYRSDCSRKHISFSAFCRKHHFEMMRGYSPPETD